MTIFMDKEYRVIGIEKEEETERDREIAYIIAHIDEM